MSQHMDTTKYYMPYDSGEDTDIESDEDYNSDNLPESEDYRIRREEDPRYAIIRTAGPNFNTSAQQLKYMEHAPGEQYDNQTNISSLKGLVYLDPPKTTVTSLFSLKSSNRDIRVWPSPFNFQIKTPRIYKNVTKFQLVQLSFPNNSQTLINPNTLVNELIDDLIAAGFTSSCISTCLNSFTNTGVAFTTIGIAEKDRVNSKGNQLLTKVEIPNGIYSNEALANELTTQANNTPPFNIISYTEFKEHFKVTRDVSLLFNEPGDNFHSRLSGIRHQNHSKETIMNTYYSQHNIDIHPIITDKIAFNAYYYPVLKELTVAPSGLFFLNLGSLSKDEFVQHILYNFQGLDSDLYYEICSTNRIILDEYRKNHTFHHHNINKYTWSWDNYLNRFVCIHDTLHTSLKNDIKNKLSTFVSHEISLASLTPSSFTSLKSNLPHHNSILYHLTHHLSSAFGTILGEQQYTFSGGQYHSTFSSGVWISRTFNDLHSSTTFTNFFNTTSTFGKALHTSGKTFTFSNFIDYHSTISSYYTLVTSSNNLISSIHGHANHRHHTYISTKYNNILPNTFVNNKSYLNFTSLPTMLHGKKLSYRPGESLLEEEEEECVIACRSLIEKVIFGYYSCLPVNSIIATLPYRLGLWTISFETFNLLSTITSISSQGNFNFLLQINNQQSFNNMDIAMTEDYNRNNLTTGQVKLMSAKILTGGLGAGEESQTCIQNPILFTNTLGKLDKLEFKIYADDNFLTPMWLFQPFTLPFYEWDATFQIDEEIGFADRNTGWGNRPTVPLPTNPNAMPFLALTSTNNPNNK